MINHITKSHTTQSTAELFDEWARQQYAVKTNNRQVKRPATLNADGQTYHQFVRVKTAELKESHKHITKQSERVKIIAKMWRERDMTTAEQESEAEIEAEIEEEIEPVDYDAMTTQELKELITTSFAIQSPEPTELPMPSWIVVDNVKIVEDADIVKKVVLDIVNKVVISNVVLDIVNKVVINDVVLDILNNVIKYNTTDDNEPKVDIDIDYELIDCCISINRGGFLNAYNILLDRGDIEELKPKVKKDTTKKDKKKGKKKKTNDADEDDDDVYQQYYYDHLEDVFNALCDAWYDYSRSYAYKQTNIFSHRLCWEAVQTMYVNDDNIHEFF